jgi:3-mercaptopyruvate sulfurtransferase SseA
MSKPWNLLVEPAQLQARLTEDNLLIVDLCCKQETYVQGHIPNAVFVNFKETQAETAPKGNLPSQENIQILLNRIGLTPNKHVVVYDDEGGGWAGRFIWLLDVVGHTNYSYLNGGLLAWKHEELPLQQTVTSVAASHYPLTTLNTYPSVDKAYIESCLGADDFIVWDARSSGEFSGEKVLATRGGHIPGAVHLEWTSAMDKENCLRIPNLDDIQAKLNALGLTKDKEIVTHCQTHHRSGYTYLLAKILGYTKVKAYPGSWSEWGNDLNTPIEC